MAIAARINTHKELIWSIADLLRGDYKQSEYGRVILPLVVLRRLDCVLEPTKIVRSSDPTSAWSGARWTSTGTVHSIVSPSSCWLLTTPA